MREEVGVLRHRECVCERDIMGPETITQKRISGGGGPSGGLPTTIANGGRGRSSTLLPRGRQLHKTFNNIKNQNIIEETNRILTEIRSDSDPSDPVNEPESFFSVNDTFALGPKISTWDQDRKTWLDQNPEQKSWIVLGGGDVWRRKWLWRLWWIWWWQ